MSSSLKLLEQYSPVFTRGVPLKGFDNLFEPYHWTRWPPCPYMVKHLKSSPEPRKVRGCSLVYRIEESGSSNFVRNLTIICWHLTFFTVRSNMRRYTFISVECLKVIFSSPELLWSVNVRRPSCGVNSCFKSLLRLHPWANWLDTC